MINLVKRLILIFPGGQQVLARLIEVKTKWIHEIPTKYRGLFRRTKSNPPESNLQTNSVNLLTVEEIFSQHYHRNVWGNKETVSGGGSTIEQTVNIRKEIPKLLLKYKIRTILDAPCGDFNWFKVMELPNRIEYVGGDIVNELVENNNLRFGNLNRKFIVIDIRTDSLPKADLWLCRDCFLHFSYEDIFLTLSNFLRSDIEFFLTSIHPECMINTDIPTGKARLINLELPPFNFGKPVLYIDDGSLGGKVRKLGLWTKEMIYETLTTG